MLDCGGLEEEHVMLFQDRGNGKEGGKPPPPTNPKPPKPKPSGTRMALQGLFLGEGGEKMGYGK